MRYLVVLEATPPPTPPPPELMTGIFALGEEATRAGVLIDSQGLAPSSAGAKVVLAGPDLTVTDGPFAESKEMISYAVYDVRTRADAVEWTSRFMALHRDLWTGWEGEARVLQVFDPQGFDPQSLDPQSLDSQNLDSQSLDSQSLDPEHSDQQGADTRAGELGSPPDAG